MRNEQAGVQEQDVDSMVANERKTGDFLEGSPGRGREESATIRDLYYGGGIRAHLDRIDINRVLLDGADSTVRGGHQFLKLDGDRRISNTDDDVVERILIKESLDGGEADSVRSAGSLEETKETEDATRFSPSRPRPRLAHLKELENEKLGSQ